MVSGSALVIIMENTQMKNYLDILFGVHEGLIYGHFQTYESIQSLQSWSQVFIIWGHQQQILEG